MRLLTAAASALIVVGCNERDQNQEQTLPAKSNPGEAILQIGPDKLPALSLMEFSESLDSVGTTTTIATPISSEYVVKVYLNDGASETEVVRETGRAQSESLEIGLFCIKDYEISKGQIRIHESGERIALDLPGSARTEKVPPWTYRPILFHTKTVTASTDELAVIVMYHPNEMTPDTFDDAENFARKRHVESLVATIQLTQPIGEQDGGAKRE